MKKIVNISLALLILACCSGTTIAFHYCGQSLQDIAVFREAKPCCEGAEMPTGCCHNEKVLVQADDFQFGLPLTLDSFHPALVAAFMFPILDFSVQFRNAPCESLIPADTGQPSASPDIVIENQSFLI